MANQDQEGLLRRGYHRNWLTAVSAGLLLTGFFGILSLVVLELLSPHPAPYLGLLYLLLAALLIGGFAGITLGMLRERRRQRTIAGHEKAAELSVDLAMPAHRTAILLFISGAVAISLLSSFGSYRAFEASESTTFCGELCHVVMEPEGTAYASSAHARVRCAECHIGPGANWFLRSKLSGLRQIWAVAFDTFPRPIPTPIHDLRPARETCEGCHWRRKFTGYKEEVRTYFLSDEQNTPRNARMLVKIGGENSAGVNGSGIHYHMLIANGVEYIATDDRRQDIAWVRVKRRDGSVSEYNNVDHPLDAEARSAYETRIMDCMDCHNRPAHQFLSPVESVNRALGSQSISTTLPFIKREAVKALDAEYPSREEALVAIASHIHDFYEKEYPQLIEERPSEVRNAIVKLQEIYESSIFPEMKARWSAYPDNINHFQSRGCFRCHNESMQTQDGRAIFGSCSTCHIVISQGEATEEVSVNLVKGLPFVHPADDEPFEEFVECSDCHTGGADLY